MDEHERDALLRALREQVIRDLLAHPQVYLSVGEAVAIVRAAQP